MLLTPPNYRPRLVDARIERAMALMGAVVIEGPKWCGKTWTGLHHAQAVVALQDPAGHYRNRRIAESDPALLFDQPRPLLLDEWQDAPALWDAVRLEIDRIPGPGRFILTGSATPRDAATAHSGAGRVARLAMGPMTLAESGMSSKAVSLATLFDGGPLRPALSAMTDQSLLDMIIRGGWPGLADRPIEDAASMVRFYLDVVTGSDASRIDGIRRDPVRLAALLASLGRNTATLVSNTTLARDMASTDDLAPAPRTISDDLDVLRRLHLLIEVPAWTPGLRSAARLRQAPKRLLVDPSLAVAAMRASESWLRAEPKTLGFCFETLCLRDLIEYGRTLDTSLFHYRDNAGLEVDAILVRPDGTWGACEIKAGAAQVDDAAGQLRRLRDKMMAGGQVPPAFLVVIAGVGGHAHTRDDGVHVVPIDTLCP